MATRTYQGQTYEQQPDGTWLRVGPAPGRQASVFQDPYAESREARAQQDQGFEAERLRIAQQNADRQASSDAVRLQIESERLRMAQEAAAREARKSDQPPLTSEARGKLEAQLAGAQGLINRITEIEQRFERDFSGSGPGALAEYLPGTLRPANQEFEDAGRALMGSLAAAFGLSAQQQNTPAELEIRFGPFIPKPGDRDDVIRAKIARLKEIARDQGGLALGQLGREDEIPALVEQLGVSGDNAPPGFTPPKAAGSGATEESIPIDPAYQAAYAGYIRDNWGNIDPQELANFRADLDRQFDYEPNTTAYMADAEALNSYAQQGATPDQVPGVAPINQDLSWLDQARNDAISNPYGAFMAGVGNAGGFGIPSLMAGDQMDAMREANPTASLLGEIAGGITGAATGGALLGQAARGVSNPRVASLLANPITADMGYGTIYGATQGDDALTGAAAGAAGALAGNVIGSQITRRLPALVGLPRPSNPLNRGEQAVASQISDIDPVADALMAADRLGVPMTGADASAPLNALAGVAARFSPEAGGVARNVMAERNLGQLGRYRQAIQRDLGPIENIPQRSDDLLQQARQQAAPLYEQAYSAPGASSVQIDDLANRPTFKQALQQAYREVADEGLDPMALGFDLNDAGEVILTRTPSWQTLDYVKRGLDNVIEAETDVINGVTSAGRRATAMKNDLLGRMDSVNPTYAQARAAYAGPAAERQMLREGQLAARESPDQLSLDVVSLSPAQREQMQLGFQSQLSQNAGRVRDNSNPWSQLYTDDAAQRLGTLYPEDSVANLLAQRDLELQLAGSANRLVGNSMTPERLAAEQLFRTAPSSIGGDIVQGGMETAVLGGPWLSVARGAGNRLFRERSQAAANRANTQLGDEVAGILLNPSPTATLDNLTDITRRQAEYEALLGEITNRAAVRGGHAGAGTGSVIAGLLAR